MATSTARREPKVSKPEVRLAGAGAFVPQLRQSSNAFDLPRKIGNRVFEKMLAGPVLQRKCACDGACSHCRDKDLLRRKEAAGVEASASQGVPGVVQEVLRSPGQPLDAPPRAFFEPRFGHDFRHVRVHTDAKATESARAVNADAYTVGANVVFAGGRYAPNRPTGLGLLGHELTHVVQQSRQGTVDYSRLTVGDPGDSAEREASQVAGEVFQGRSGQPVRSAGNVIQRSAVDALALPTMGAFVGLAAGGPIGLAIGALAGLAVGSVWGWLTGAFSGTDRSHPPEANPDGSCKSARVDVRASHTGGQGSIAKVVGALPIYHLYVVYTNHRGGQTYFRGGPGGHCANIGTGEFGTLKSLHGPYVPGTIDWDSNAPSTTALTGSQACGKDQCLEQELQRIDAKCVPYDPLGNNSNTVVRTLLSKCGIPQKKPVPITPGWGQPEL